MEVLYLLLVEEELIQAMLGEQGLLYWRLEHDTQDTESSSNFGIG